MSDPDIYEDDGETIYVSTSASATASVGGPDDDGPAGVREPLDPVDFPPSLSAQAARGDA